MKPWILTTLQELERALDTAREAKNQAHREKFTAEERFNDAHRVWSNLECLVQNFREFADAQAEGGAQ